MPENWGGQCTYLYTRNLGNTQIPDVHRGVDIRRTKHTNPWKVYLREVVTQAQHTDVLFLTGSSAVDMLAAYLYQKRNPRGKVVVFGDMEEPQARELNRNGFHYSGSPAGWVKDRLTDYFFRHATYLVANTAAHRLMADLCRRKHWGGLLHFYPCLDDEKFLSYGLSRKPFAEKENMMVCVGRIGCHQKNTEMLLDALRKVDLKDWKIYMLGPVTSGFDLSDGGDFQRKIDRFFEECPQHRGKVVFTGMVYDQKEVFGYYNRAKVLVMTSRHESWGNVYSEAAALGCYILSTDVGGATLCSNDWKFGYKLQQEDADGLALALNDMVSGRIDMDEKNEMSFYELSYSYLVNRLLLPKMGFEPLGETINFDA